MTIIYVLKYPYYYSNILFHALFHKLIPNIMVFNISTNEILNSQKQYNVAINTLCPIFFIQKNVKKFPDISAKSQKLDVK